LCEHALVEAGSARIDESVDESMESRGYSMHGCVHSWTVHVVNEGWDGKMVRLALRCVGLHVPSKNGAQYWVTQQRLMRHANRFRSYVNGVLAGQDEDGDTLDAVHCLGNLYADQGRLDKAEQMYEQALAGKEKALGRDHTLTLVTVNNLGILYKMQGRLDEAEKMYKQVLSGYKKRFGTNDPRCYCLCCILATFRENAVA
jgi:tetratricopeptide (TPR) repeat protein